MFDPSKRVKVDLNKLWWARFRYNMKLYCLAMLIIGIPLALILWVIVEYFK
jgi:hypothetical protein